MALVTRWYKKQGPRPSAELRARSMRRMFDGALPQLFCNSYLALQSAAGIPIVRQAKAEYQQIRCSRAWPMKIVSLIIPSIAFAEW